MMLSHAVMNTLWCTLSYTCYDAMMWWCILHYALYDVHVCHGVMTLSYVLWCILVDDAQTMHTVWWWWDELMIIRPWWWHVQTLMFDDLTITSNIDKQLDQQYWWWWPDQKDDVTVITTGKIWQWLECRGYQQQSLVCDRSTSSTIFFLSGWQDGGKDRRS